MMDATTKLVLFGVPRLTKNNNEIILKRRQAMALLAYLVLEKGPHSREALAALLWPDVPLSKARVSLRSNLPLLKKSLGATLVVATRKTVELVPHKDFWLDTAVLQQAHAQTLQHHPDPADPICDTCAHELQKATALYQAPFMADFSLPDSPNYERWQTHRCQEFRRQLSTMISRLITYHLTRDDNEQALAFARQWVSLDSYNEAAHRRLMQLYEAAGQRPLALHHYLALQQTLARELGTAPEAETTAVYKTIQGKRASQRTLQAHHTPTLPPHNLPLQLNRFLGRQVEIREIVERLEKPHCRLLTILGPGGIGKSRLAIEVGQMLLPLFSDGVYFVPLAAIEKSDLIVSTIADAIGFRFYGHEETQRQLLNYLNEKEMLLILDNFEHVLDGSPFLIEILTTAPQVKCMITSRISLNLQAEWLYELDGLPYPVHEEQEPAEKYTAVDLFIDRAQQRDHKFNVTPEIQPTIHEICRFVEGTPLAIELLAPLVRTCPCQQIAHDLQKDIDILQTTMLDVPLRHRRFRAVFEQSWRLLSADERLVLKMLTVFPGSFHISAAEFVAGTTADIVEQLRNKSLIKQLSQTRFEMHELIKQFASERLSPPQRQAVNDRHGRYFAEFMKQKREALQSGNLVQTLQDISVEFENIRAAWSWAIQQENEETITGMMASLYHFYRSRGQLAAGNEMFATAVAHLTPRESNQNDLALTNQQLIGRLLAYQAWFCLYLGGYSQADTLVEASLKYVQKVDDKQYVAFLFLLKGTILAEQHGAYLDSLAFYRNSYELYRELGLQRGMAISLNNLGISYFNLGDHQTARQLYQEAITICEQNHFLEHFARCINNLGTVFERDGLYSEANAAYQACLDVCQQLQNKFGMAISLINLSEVALRQEQFAEAANLCQQQLHLLHEIGDRHHLVGGLAALGNAYYMTDKYPEAWETLCQSLDVAVKIQSQPDIALVLGHIARLLYWQNRAEASLKLLTIVQPLINFTPNHQGNPANLFELLLAEIPENKRDEIQTRWQNKSLDKAVAFAHTEYERYLENAPY